MHREYEVTNLFNGQVEYVRAETMEEAMTTFLCGKFFPNFIRPVAREQIQMHGLSSLGRICGLHQNHFVYTSGGHVCEWEFIDRGVIW